MPSAASAVRRDGEDTNGKHEDRLHRERRGGVGRRRHDTHERIRARVCKLFSDVRLERMRRGGLAHKASHLFLLEPRYARAPPDGVHLRSW